MRGFEAERQFNQKETSERQFSEVELDYIKRTIETDLVASRTGIRYGDEITITNEGKDGSPEDVITLFINENPTLRIESKKGPVKEYNLLFRQSVDFKNGLAIKNIFSKTVMPDSAVVNESVYNIIKEAGIDLDNLSDTLKEKGIEPLRFEGGGFVAKNKQTGKVEVILRKNKKIFCREGKTYNMQIEGNIPSSEDYETLFFYHYHPGFGESLLIPSAPDLRNIIKLKIPSIVFADSSEGGFIGREYKIKEKANLEELETEIKKIEGEYRNDKDWKNNLKECGSIADKYFDAKEIESFEKLFWSLE